MATKAKVAAKKSAPPKETQTVPQKEVKAKKPAKEEKNPNHALHLPAEIKVKTPVAIRYTEKLTAEKKGVKFAKEVDFVFGTYYGFVEKLTEDHITILFIYPPASDADPTQETISLVTGLEESSEVYVDEISVSPIPASQLLNWKKQRDVLHSAKPAAEVEEDEPDEVQYE